nr:unnamed protein product [Digitaria exilis]
MVASSEALTARSGCPWRALHVEQQDEASTERRSATVRTAVPWAVEFGVPGAGSGASEGGSALRTGASAVRWVWRHA